MLCYFLDYDGALVCNKIEKTGKGEPQRKCDFEHFSHRSENMFIVWEKIISNLSGADVANCLKVNKRLRIIVGQFLASSSKLHREIDLKATVQSLKKGKFQSTATVHFKCKNSNRQFMKNFGSSISDDDFFAIDDIWFYSLLLLTRLRENPHRKTRSQSRWGTLQEVINNRKRKRRKQP